MEMGNVKLIELPMELLISICCHLTHSYSPQMSSSSASSDPLDRNLMQARKQLHQLSATCRLFRNVVGESLKSFLNDFGLCIELVLKSLQYKTRHPSHAQSSGQTSLLFDIKRCQLLHDSHSHSIAGKSLDGLLRFVPFDDSPDRCCLEFTESLDPLRELSVSIVSNNNSTLSNHAASQLTEDRQRNILKSSICDRVYRLDLSDYEGLHYIMEQDAVLCYTLTKHSTQTMKQIFKNGEVVDIPVSVTKQVLTVHFVHLHSSYFLPSQTSGAAGVVSIYEDRLKRLKEYIEQQSAVKSSIVVNYSHELVLQHVHAEDGDEMDEPKHLQELFEILHLYNGLCDRRTIIDSVLCEHGHGMSMDEIYSVSEFKRFVLQSTPLSPVDMQTRPLPTISSLSLSPMSSAHSSMTKKYMITDRYKCFIRWRGITSLVTDEMVNVEKYRNMADMLVNQQFHNNNHHI